MSAGRIILIGVSLFLLSPLPSLGNSLPETIGAFRLKQVISGKEAKKEIDRLHGKKIGYKAGYIGSYEDGDKKARIWISEYSVKSEAVEGIRRMSQGLKANEGTPFWHFREISIDGLPVYFAVGMGQVHYFFQKGIRIIWLAADPAPARKTIRDLISKTP